MRHTPGWTAALVAIVLASHSTAQVEDTADLFSPDKIDEANTRIARIRKQLGKQVVIYTVAEVPPGLASAFNLGDARQKQEFFDQWARARMRELGRNQVEAACGLLMSSTSLNVAAGSAYTLTEPRQTFEGIHILICQKPRHIEITVSKDTEPLFSKWYRDVLHRRLVSKIQPDNPNQNIVQSAVNRLRGGAANKGLIRAVDFIGNSLHANRPVDQSRWFGALSVMSAILASWFVLGIVSRRLQKGTPPEAGITSGDDEGRSIAVLGGGIGAVCGQWLVNRWLVRRPERPPSSARLDVQDLPAEEPAPDKES